MSEGAVRGIYASLRKQFPNASVRASTFDAFYDAFRALSPAEHARLPVITQEIGDTWLYGVPSDPLKNVHFREMSRRRRACVEERRCHPEDPTMQRFDRLLTKVPEVTSAYYSNFRDLTTFGTGSGLPSREFTSHRRSTPGGRTRHGTSAITTTGRTRRRTR